MLNAERIRRDVVVLGASAGGIEAFIELFSALSAGFPALIAVVLHRSPLYNLNLAKVVGRRSVLPVIEPESGTTPKPGTIYLAPRDHHMLFEQGRLVLNRGPKMHFTRPAIDPLFASAAETYGPRVVGILLSGGGDDGVAGLIAIKKAHGLVLIQDPQEAKNPSMPSSALLRDHVDLVLSLARIPRTLLLLAQGEAVETEE